MSTSTSSREESVEELKKKILLLEATIVSLEKENQELRAKNKRKRDADTTSDQLPAKKLKPSQVTKLFQKWGRAVAKKAKSTKFTQSSGTVQVIEEGFEKEKFDELFGGKGELIQPTPTNKPKSIITIIRFADWDKVKELFGESNITQSVEGALYSSRAFEKSRKCGTVDLSIQSLSVHYNRSKKKLELDFYCSGYDDY